MRHYAFLLLTLLACEPDKDEFELPDLNHVEQQEDFLDQRDGQAYKVTSFDDVTVIAENINYNVPGSFCPGNCNETGRLYTFSEAQQACPAGWHLPTVNEWILFANNLNPDYFSEFDDQFYLQYNYVLRDYFDLKLAGYQTYDGDLQRQDEVVYFWSTTPSSKSGSSDIMVQFIRPTPNESGGTYTSSGSIPSSRENRLSCMCFKD